jgi:hypothetical protein
VHFVELLVVYADEKVRGYPEVAVLGEDDDKAEG